MKNPHLLIFILPLFLFSCYKDIDHNTPIEEIIPITEIYVNTKIAGTVVDSNGNIITDYNLIINNDSYPIESTHFIFELSEVKKKGQTIYVEKAGKIIGLGTVLLVENDINQIEIKLFNDWEQIHSNTISNDIVLSQIDINIDNYSLNDSDGNNYTQNININHGKINLDHLITNIGYSTEHDLLVLEPLGGFYIAISDDSNQKLHINQDHPINTRLKTIPDEATSLFFFNEKEEKWLKVKEIIKGNDELDMIQTGYYIYAKSSKGLFVTGDVNYESNPVSYQALSWSNDILKVKYTTTLNGHWITIMPENEELSIELSNHCGVTIHTESFATLKTDITKKNISVENKSEQFSALHIKVIDCNGTIIDNPAIVINGQAVYNFEGDEINTWISSGCGLNTIAGQSNTNGTIGPAIPWNNAYADELNVLSNCEDLNMGYSFLKIDTEIKLYESFELQKQGGKSIFSSKDKNVKILIQGQSVGKYTENAVNIYINDKDFGSNGYYINCEQSTLGCGISECVISQYENDGWTILKLNGDIWVQDLKANKAKTVPLEGTIIIKR